MDKVSVQFEIVIYLHACKNQEYLENLESEYFSNKYVSRLFKLTKVFHKKYKDIPFSMEDPSTEQIEHLLDVNPTLFKFKDDLLSDENTLKNEFVENVRNIISTNYTKFNPKIVDENCRSFIIWKNFEKRFDNAISYVKSKKIDNDNVKETIDKAMEIVNDAMVNFGGGDEQAGMSFWDTNTHIQPDPEAVQDCGFPYLNRFFSKYGGSVEGQFIVFLGATNIGKSIVLINVALGLALNGYNVCLASLEMAEYAIASRGGARIFDVDINEYPMFAENLKEVQYQIDKIKNQADNGRPVGELLIKQFHRATPKDLKNWVLYEEKTRNIKVNSLVMDYLGEMGNDHGTGQGTPFEMYIFHKQNTQDLTADGIKHKYSVITAHQDKDISKEATDISLTNLSESKGIAHKADAVIGLIQPPEAKANGRFYMKNLKSRDNPLLDYWIEFDINYSRMKLIERALHEAGSLMV